MFNSFKEDLKVNHAKWYHRAFWFFLFLRGSQISRGGIAQIFRILCKLGKKIVLIGSNCELPSDALVGKRIYIPHFNGIIVSPYARIEDEACILQQVTIGVDFEKDPFKAPKLGKNVLLGAGAKLIGDISLGDNVKVGANAVVTKDIPANKTVVGANKLL